MEKVSLRAFGIIGIVLFVPLFVFTFADPQLIEKSAKSFVEWKLQLETDKIIESIRLPEIAKLETLLGARAEKPRKETEARLENVKRQLKNDAPAILAAQIARLRNLDCECRKKWGQPLRLSTQFKLITLENAKAKLIDFSHVKYMEIVKKSTLDIRIFLGANALIFVFLLLISLMKPKAVKHLLLPGALMLVSTVTCSYFYLFEQNWFYTIVYNDYTGFGYIAYLVVVFGILCDIVFNKARATTNFINSCLHTLGHAASFAPC